MIKVKTTLNDYTGILVNRFFAGVKLFVFWAVVLSPFLFLTGCPKPNIPPQALCYLSNDTLPQFDFPAILHKAELARYAYRDSATVHEALDSLYEVKVFALPASAGQVILLTDSAARKQVVSIRGTVLAEYKSILTDAQYTKEKNAKLGIYIHKGFHKAAEELYQVLRPQLNPQFTTEITGHSLGGALAVLFSYYLTIDSLPLGRTVTFGQPKVTNKAGTEKFKSVRLLRVVNNEDPVAFIPPLSFVTAIHSPYQHAGGALVLKDSVSHEYICSEASNITFVTEFWRDLLGQDDGAVSAFMNNLSFHRDKNYIQNLKAQKNP